MAGTLRVGTVSDPQSIRLGRVLAAALRVHPHLELVVSRQVSGEALESVREGRLDASYYFGERPGDDIAALELSQIAYRVVVPAAWPDRPVDGDWAGLASLPWLLTPQISSYYALVTQLFAQHGLPLPARYVESDDEGVIRNLVASGVGASLVREEAAQELEREGQAVIWGSARVVSTLWFIALAARRDDPLIRATQTLVRDSWVFDNVEDRLAIA